MNYYKIVTASNITVQYTTVDVFLCYIFTLLQIISDIRRWQVQFTVNNKYFIAKYVVYEDYSFKKWKIILYTLSAYR